MPSVCASWCASVSKAVVVTTTAGVPRRASVMASWRLHDVQDPQSADPVNTTSHCLASSATISGGAGVEALALRRRTTCFTP